ncbi:substrate-binding domain-containing protein [Mesorhizobium sp. BAC0120]|uniref:substrate-binding domain-containing protein n=1 Tax=Mesorhizobium sp. BAC0120 TaxID=3090670 RepID=UPI00298D1E56|nr:substrate-binding domain-containing protein [Mesorhizobium sp. BAC0120]MDW6026440.1 substrate-binding domain-containing protein [Mesorhizobium sp. BAC0120]
MSRNGTSRLRIALLAMGVLALLPSNAGAQGAGLGAAGELVDPDVLRVCADPSSMPSSDESGQGFENKLAELVANKTGRKSVAYTWFPMVTGFVRNTLRANRCDIIMGYAQGDELVQNTNAYYRSAYVLVYPKGRGLDGVETIEDPRLVGKRIGVVQSTPPCTNMARATLMRTAKIYPLMIDTRSSPSMGEVMINDLVKGETDAAIVWGPMAGYYIKKSGADLVTVPLVKEKGGSRMAYRITMGVRPSDQEWKRTLNQFIRNNQKEINKILLDYNVPLIDEQDRPITQ